MLTNKLKLLSMVLGQMSTVKNIPFKVTIDKSVRDNPRFSLVPASNKYMWKLHMKSYFITIMLATLLFQVTHGKSLTTGEELSLDEKLIGCATILMFSVLTIHIHQTGRKGPELMGYLKGIIQLTEQNGFQHDKELVPGSFRKLPFLELLNMTFVPVALLNGFVFPPAFTLGFHFINPCKVSLAGYWLLQECQAKCLEDVDDSNGPIVTAAMWKVVKGGILLGNCWAWFFSVHATIFLVTSVEILSMYLIRDGIRSFWNKLKLGREPHHHIAPIYRQFQLLNILCNSAQKYALGTLIVGSILILSSSFAVLVRMAGAEKRSLTMILVLGVASLDAGVALLIVLGGIVRVYAESKQVLEQVKWINHNLYGDDNDERNYHKNSLERKWKKRFWRSCTLIKINFGGSNFIEELTPLNCTDFAVDLSVQLMLAR